jgi:two-component system LytT family response regulator
MKNPADLNDETKLERLRFNSHHGPVSVEIDKILFIKANGNYSEIFIEEEARPVFVTQNLHSLESVLKEENFLRSHNSWLVSIRKIRSYYKKDRIVIINNYCIPVSRRKWKCISRILTDEGIKLSKNFSWGY